MHSFFAEVSTGLSRYLSPHGYQTVLTNSDESPEREVGQIGMLLSRHVDGLVIASSQDNWQAGMPPALRDGKIPYVLIDRQPDMEGINYVGTRDLELGMLATEHLIQQGCRRVAHVGGPRTPHSRMRLLGYQKILAKYGRGFDPEYLAVGGNNDNDGYRAARQLLSLKYPPDGVFCYSDPVAIGLIKAILEAGLRVPQDIAVIGAGNVHYSDLFRVPLSTVDQGSSRIGEIAAEILLESIESKAPPGRVVLLEPKVVVRESSRRSG
jgi:LacI family transcriptional regulator